MTVKIDARAGEVLQTFECGSLFARETTPARMSSGHSLTQRTETAICFWP